MKLLNFKNSFPKKVIKKLFNQTQIHQAHPGRKSNQAGMTLIEVIAVVVLIGLIMGVVISNVTQSTGAAKAKLNEQKMQTLEAALEQYRLEFNTYPATLENLVKPSSNKEKGTNYIPTIKEEAIKDVWNNPYIYKAENNNRSYSITSYGEDGVAGGEGVKADVTRKR